MAKVVVRLEVVGPGGLDQAIEQGAGLDAPGRAGKQPVLAAKHKGEDGVFRHVVVRCDHGLVELDEQPHPLVEGIAYCISEQPLEQGLSGPFAQPLVEGVQDRPGLLRLHHPDSLQVELPGLGLLFDAVELADVDQGLVGAVAGAVFPWARGP